MSQQNQTHSSHSESTVVLIRSETVGHGDDELGANLMMNFLHQLSEADRTPDVVIMMNAAVKLAVEGSEVLDALKALESKGATILACGTCLNFFEMKDRQRVGKASNMLEITNTLLGASNVITL